MQNAKFKNILITCYVMFVKLVKACLPHFTFAYDICMHGWTKTVHVYGGLYNYGNVYILASGKVGGSEYLRY